MRGYGLEDDVDDLAAGAGAHVDDLLVTGGVDYAGLTGHLPPQVLEVLGRHRDAVGPLGLLIDGVADGLWGVRQRCRGQQQVAVEDGLAVDAGDERAGEQQRGDEVGVRTLVGEEVWVEPRLDTVEREEDAAVRETDGRAVGAVVAHDRWGWGVGDAAGGDDEGERGAQYGGCPPARVHPRRPHGLTCVS